MANVLLALFVVLGIGTVFAYLTGMWSGHGGFHGSLGPVAFGFAVAAAVLGLLDVTGLFASTPFPAPPHIGPIDAVSLLVSVLPYAAAYLVWVKAPFGTHHVVTAAVFDRLYEGIRVRRAYSQRHAGGAMREILSQRGLAGYR